LADAGVSYLDLTGNSRIRLDRPALWVLTEGAARDPSPLRRGVRTLKGAKAARLVRALCDWKPPVRVRELARRAGLDAGYATRILRLLEEENVLERGARGEIRVVRWRELLELWTRDYQVTTTNRPLSCLSPRGIGPLLEALRSSPLRYALTGSVAVPSEAADVPAARALCFVDEVDLAIRHLGLTPTEVGANVVLLKPFDPLVYERSRTKGELTCVALTQCLADLLTGTGREPSQGEALATWMAENESVWRLS
jgi:hypothetical protein